ncbi:MAG: glycosyltransferase family 4 protein [Candidatus Bathyarchaeota archaeon]|nr:glycosyltransferase family 4 protein [Candidatus Bathyarchaeota archaeon]
MAKFLVIHPNMDIYGGGERVAHHIIKALIAHGQKVELLSFDFDENRYAEILGEKLPDATTVHMLGHRIEAEPPFSVYKRRRKIIQAVRQFKKGSTYDYTFSTQTLSAFEAELFDKGKGNIAYVHFPEIHYDYAHSKRTAKIYLWLYKKLLEGGIGKLDLVFANSNYTKTMTEHCWKKFGAPEPVVAYPPVENQFWSNKPLDARAKRVVYIGRFIPKKRHEILKKLAKEFPTFEFVSVGLLRDTEEAWFENFSKDLPTNYKLKPNLPEADLIGLLQDSQVYCHLMEGEHFGIAPMEALASGCITLVHNSGGSGELIPTEYRWNTYVDLKEKIATLTAPNQTEAWQNKRQQLQDKISLLKPENFQQTIWTHVEALMRQTENDN